MLAHAMLHYALNKHLTKQNYVYKSILILPYYNAVCFDKWGTTNLDILAAPSPTSTILSVTDRDFNKQTAITTCEYLMYHEYDFD